MAAYQVQSVSSYGADGLAMHPQVEHRKHGLLEMPGPILQKPRVAPLIWSLVVSALTSSLGRWRLSPSESFCGLTRTPILLGGALLVHRNLGGGLNVFKND